MEINKGHAQKTSAIKSFRDLFLEIRLCTDSCIINPNANKRAPIKTTLKTYTGQLKYLSHKKATKIIKAHSEAIEKIKRPFFPLKRMVNDLEKLMIHWGEWYSNNLKKS